jgi:hypothetical protein
MINFRNQHFDQFEFNLLLKRIKFVCAPSVLNVHRRLPFGSTMPPRRADPVQPAQAAESAHEPVRFAIAPALANGNIIDFTTPGGAKLFKTGTDALASQFNCTAVYLQLFLDQLRDKAAIFNWTEILQAPDDHDVPKDLIDHYGEVSCERVKAHAETYVHEDSRRDQDSFMLYNCIMNSLTDSGQN